MATAIITRAEYTTYTGIAIAVADEARYDALIQAATDFIVENCNNTFPDGYPAPVKLACADMVTYMVSQSESPGMESETQGNYSYKRYMGTGPWSAYPSNVQALLAPYCYLHQSFGTISYKPGDKRGLESQDYRETAT